MVESILILTYSMIPYTPYWGGCQRMYYLAKDLVENGFNVFVVHIGNNYIGDLGHPIPFHSIPIALSDLLFNTSKKVTSNVSLSSKENAIKQTNKLSKLKYIIKPLILFAEKYIYNEINQTTGLAGEIFVFHSKDKIATIIRANNIKIIIISAPPFSLFNIIGFLKHKFKDINMILDYRDPWNLWNNGSLISRHKEKRYLNLADEIVFVNDKLMIDTVKKFGLDVQKCKVIFNGYSEDTWNNIFGKYTYKGKPKDYIQISYIGGISFKEGGYRDLSTFWSAFEKFKHNDKVKIRFVGIDNFADTSELKERFVDSVEFIPKVSHEDSLKYMLDSDVLLLVHTHNDSAKYILTGKFFDYARSKKILLGIGSVEDTYFLNMIREYKLGVAAINEVNSILNAFDLIYHHWNNGSIAELRSDERFNYNDFSRSKQNEKYINIIKNL